MKKGYPPLRLSAALLALALIWRMLGAPVDAEQFHALETPAWQARVLMPSRVSRVLKLWLPAQTDAPPPETLDMENAEERELARLDGALQDEAVLSVYLADENRLAEMTLEGYVSGVVAAEMPAAWHAEALKAQAVAARTRAVYQAANGGCALHPGADICTDSGHCQAYASPARCRELWADAYQAYRERVLASARDTQGELILYGDEPITVMYHAISGGMTEASQTVFAQALPYLVSVESRGEEGARGFFTDTTMSFETLSEQLNKERPTLNAKPEDVRQTLTIGGYTPTGRVKDVLVCGHAIPASEFRRALGLRSTWFTLSADANGVTFHQRGYGHGVGMSQVGANGMAADGAGYRDILTHYYPGTTVEQR